MNIEQNETLKTNYMFLIQINRLYCHCMYKAFIVEGDEVYVKRLTNINESNFTVLDHDIE